MACTGVPANSNVARCIPTPEERPVDAAVASTLYRGSVASAKRLGEIDNTLQRARLLAPAREKLELERAVLDAGINGSDQIAEELQRIANLRKRAMMSFEAVTALNKKEAALKQLGARFETFGKYAGAVGLSAQGQPPGVRLARSLSLTLYKGFDELEKRLDVLKKSKGDLGVSVDARAEASILNIVANEGAPGLEQHIKVLSRRNAVVVPGESPPSKTIELVAAKELLARLKEFAR